MSQINQLNRVDNVLNQTNGLNRSARYATATSADVIHSMIARGFNVTDIVVTKPRNRDKESFQKHMIRLTHPDLQRPAFEARGLTPEIIIINSYDGTTALKFLFGVYRMVCANGLIAGTTYGEESIRHVGNIAEKYDDALNRLTARLPQLSDQIESMSGKQLDRDSALVLADSATKLVLPDSAVWCNTELALKPKRSADTATDLFTVFNRLQERLIRGGVQYVSATKDINGFESTRRGTTRAIKSVSRQVEVNRKLWDIAASIVS